MSQKLYLEIITPDKTFFSGEVDMLIYSTTDGERGIMRDHNPMVTPVNSGIIRLKDKNEWKIAAVSEGFLEVTLDNTIMIVDTAEWAKDIDAERAGQAKDRAEKRLAAKISDTEYLRTKAAIARAKARLKAVKKID